MQRGHKLTRPSGLDLPAPPDRSGMPCVESVPTRKRPAAARRRDPRSLPGLSPTSLIASVEGVAARDGGDWLIWGSVDNRPVLFAVEAGAAAEMMRSVTAGEMATAIIEPWQLVLEQLD